MFDKHKPCFSRPNLRTITFRNLLQNSLVVIFYQGIDQKSIFIKYPVFFYFPLHIFNQKWILLIKRIACKALIIYIYRERNLRVFWAFCQVITTLFCFIGSIDCNIIQILNFDKRSVGHIAHVSNNSQSSDQISIAISNSKYLDNLVELILHKKWKHLPIFFHIFLC